MSQAISDEVAAIRSELVDDLASSPSNNGVAWKQALNLWLRWNEAHQRVADRMFRTGQDQQQIEDLMDQLDRVRREAVAQSEKLIEC